MYCSLICSADDESSQAYFTLKSLNVPKEKQESSPKVQTCQWLVLFGIIFNLQLKKLSVF